MYCHIIKDKTTGEEFLIPSCWPVISHWGEDSNDRKIIKDYCQCERPQKKGEEKYETHTKDEVVSMIQSLESKLQHHQNEIRKIYEDLDGIKQEVFMLNTVEVTDLST